MFQVNAKEVIVKDTSKNGKRARDLYLPMQDVDNYETTYGHIKFQISDGNLAHTILNITVAKGLSFIVSSHELNRL